MHSFRFVVKPQSKTAARCMGNADYAVDWNEVEQVVRCDLAGRSIAQPACPICLDEPSPAKVTRCGHVYWCVLHALHAGLDCADPDRGVDDSRVATAVPQLGVHPTVH